jgi:hypothetical protein
MTTAVAMRNGNGHGEIMEAVLIKGDLSKLTPQERSDFYLATCRSIGLNPTTRPLEYITLNGKLTLYARRDAADQLRKIHGISVEIVKQSMDGDLFTVHVRAKDKNGRSDEDLGVVALGKLIGEARANATLKAITKAKRRVTLSICGLGFLDETEIEDIPASAKRSNPHVTRPEDVEDDPAPPQWQFKQSADPTRLLKKSDPKQREIGERLQKEFFAIHNMAELREWFQSDATQESAEQMRGDWLDMMSRRLWAHVKDVEALTNSNEEAAT